MVQPSAAEAPTDEPEAIIASVLLCSRNPRDAYLSRTLDGLRRQTLSSARWELLLVDNGSEAPLATRFPVDWHPHGRGLRVETVGKSHALIEGIAAARGEILLIVDDDNVLDPRYLETLIDFLRAHPFIGVVNGRVRGEFEQEPPRWARGYLYNMAIRDPGAAVQWSLMPGFSGVTCWGAGMGLRRVVARRWVEELSRDARRLRFCRRGESLVGCEDGDLALCAFDLGLAQAYDPDLELKHLIPAARLTPAYMRKLVYSNRLAARLLLLVRGVEEAESERPLWHRSGRYLASLLGDLIRVGLGRVSLHECRLLRARRAGERAALKEYRAWGPKETALKE